jgi:hypothetical protein
MKQEKIGRRRGKLVCMTAVTLLFVSNRSFAQTVPMTSYNIGGSGGYSGVLVGGNPFGETKPVTIDAILIPLIIQVTNEGWHDRDSRSDGSGRL